MKDIWFADNRDLVKWSVLFHLAEMYRLELILQLAYYRPSTFPPISIDGKEVDPPKEIIDFFRNIKNIEKVTEAFRIDVLGDVYEDREAYLDAATPFIQRYSGIPKIVFLDPDTGLAPKKPNMSHVTEYEVEEIWHMMIIRDVFVFYQHQTNRNGQPWIEPKRKQLVDALGISDEEVKVAHGNGIARDVVFFYAQKTKY